MTEKRQWHWERLENGKFVKVYTEKRDCPECGEEFTAWQDSPAGTRCAQCQWEGH